jgi:ankyrin repeat protein
LVDQEKTTYLSLMHLLIDRGANLNPRLGKEVWERTLTETRAWADVAGTTAFFRAAWADDVKAMELLKEAGADTNIPNKNGVTPLMAAAGVGWTANYATTAPTRVEAVEYCLKLGENINQTDDRGYTALGGAAFVGDLTLIHFMVDHGADLNAKSKAGDSVADMANGLFEKSLPQPKAVDLLVSLGIPKPHNCRSSECLPEINAKVKLTVE